MGNTLRISINSRQRLFEKHLDVGVCHEFKPKSSQEGCNCPKTEKPEPYHVLTIKPTACQ